MTFLDRLRKEHPEFIGEKFPGGVAICPEDCGYEKSTPCGAMTVGAFDASACMACWEREAPDTSSAAAAAPSPKGEGREGGGGHG